jgi:hypothetical protein
MDSAVDRLAAVSGIMYDQRIIDLNKENKELRCEVAIFRYGEAALNRGIMDVNDTGLTEVCNCAGCFLSKRFCIVEPEELSVRFTSSEVPNQVCVLQKCFIWQCSQLGLVSEVVKETDDTDDSADEREASERDCHVVILDRGVVWEVFYGSRFSPIDFHLNPDLPSLKALFALLDDGTDFFIVDGKDYRAAAEDMV